jgi:plasmid maintenance system killer protein
MEIQVTDEFKKLYAGLPLGIKKKAEKQEQFFKSNPFYSSLNTEKLEPKTNQVWSFRVDRNYRILFKFLGKQKAIFLTVGPHDWIYKKGI